MNRTGLLKYMRVLLSTVEYMANYVYEYSYILKR